jgi:NAD(P)-dependent dehydrogenase (short-subunit alcohol dehydrogenase family)
MGGFTMGRFSNKVAIVTGGASGIGRATMDQLLSEGCKVIFSDLSDAGAEIAAELRANGHPADFIQGDMAEEPTCKAIVERAAAKWGRVDFLVNNAFSFIAKGADATRDDWDRMMHVGPIAYATMAALCAPHMKAAGGGAIVNVSSISAFIAQPNRWTYNTAKGAVHNLTKCLALDFAPMGIRVNSISPGWIWTAEVLKAAAGDRKKWTPVWGKFHMLRRLGEPAEVAKGIAFLLSDDASFITAIDLPIDGGYQGMGSEGLGEVSSFAGSE